MTSLPDQIALHLGAHKTASTHLQRSLAAATLPGVQVVGPSVLRGSRETLPERFGFPLDAEKAARSPVDVRQTLIGLADGAQRLVISDENFPGKLQTGWGRVPTPLYPTAAKRLQRLVEAITSAGGPPSDVYIAIRNPADYLTSIYSQVLHGGRLVRPEAFTAKNPPTTVDWCDYIARLADVAGLHNLTIWRYEDYAPLFGRITQDLTGIAGITPLGQRVQQRLSQAALEALLAAKDLGLPSAATEARKMHPVTAEAPPLTLYGAEAHDAAKAAYTRQWARLQQMSQIRCLTPE